MSWSYWDKWSKQESWADGTSPTDGDVNAGLEHEDGDLEHEDDKEEGGG